MSPSPADERSQVLDAAETPQERLFSREELELIRLIEDVQRKARMMGLDVSEVLAPRKLRTDAFLWRSSQRMRTLERYLQWLKRSI